MKKTIIQFIKFGIVGLSNTIISYFIYTVLVYFGLYFLIASIIAFIVSVFNSFFWNNKYVFKRSKDTKGIIKTIIRTFVSYGLTGLILHNILLFLFIEFVHISKYVAPVFCLVITVPLNFILNKIWVFNSPLKGTA